MAAAPEGGATDLVKKNPRHGPATNPLRYPRQPQFQRRARGIGKGQGGGEPLFPQAAADLPEGFGWRERKNFVQERLAFPHAGEFFGCEQGHARAGPGLAQADQGGSGHDGVSQPVDAAHKDAFWSGHVQRRQILRTQSSKSWAPLRIFISTRMK
jgi:hypothetical protein